MIPSVVLLPPPPPLFPSSDLFPHPQSCQVEVESDPAKLISDDCSSDAEDIDIEY